MEYNFSEVIENLLREHRKTKKSLADALGMTRQGFDTKLKNKTVYITDVERMAFFFNMEEADLLLELSSKDSAGKIKRAFDNNNLHLNSGGLEKQLAKLIDQLAVKDQQIAGLQRTVDALVGKSEDATEEPLSTEEIDKLMLLYKKKMLSQVIAPAKTQRRNQRNQPVAKLVASR